MKPIVFQARSLKYWVLGPSGLSKYPVLRQRETVFLFGGVIWFQGYQDGPLDLSSDTSLYLYIVDLLNFIYIYLRRIYIYIYIHTYMYMVLRTLFEGTWWALYGLVYRPPRGSDDLNQAAALHVAKILDWQSLPTFFGFRDRSH